MLLTGSEREGDDVRLQMNRHYLARALKLGFRELCLYGATSPAACHDESRSYVWALLDSESAIQPCDHAIQIESPLSGSLPPQSRFSTRSNPKVKDPVNPNSNGHPEGNGHVTNDVTPTSQPVNRVRRKLSQYNKPGLIEHAEQLRTALRDTLVRTNELLKAIKQERRQSRLVRNSHESLRQLKTIGV